MTEIILTIAAFLTSIISGIVGMAGGVTLLGVMSAILPAGQVVPLHGVVQLASNSTRTVVFIKDVAWRIFLRYSIPLVIGVWASTFVWSGDKLGWFKPAVGGFILAFLLWRWFKPALRNLPLWSFVPLGLVVGFATIFIGSTGPLIAPFFLRDDLENEQVIATKAACQTVGHTLKIPAFIALGFNYLPHWPLLGALLIAVIVGTVLARRILKLVSRQFFVILYQVVLALIALYLILSGFTS